MKGQIRIGTSGWHYKEWNGRFYPKDCPPKDYLKAYTKYFNTVEVNSPFYHLPLVKTVQNWHDQTPANFIFSVKASRLITHMKKLNEPKEALNEFFKSIAPFKNKLGPILFQLPPRWHSNAQRLKEFLDILPRKYRYTFELRDETWFNPEIIQILKDYNAAFCIYDFNHRLSPKIVTADFVYVRFHGPKGKYVGSYDHDFLKTWHKDFINWSNEGKDVYCYFDNTVDGSAIKNAQELIDLGT